MGAATQAEAPTSAQFDKVKYMHIMGCSLMADPYLGTGDTGYNAYAFRSRHKDFF